MSGSEQFDGGTCSLCERPMVMKPRDFFPDGDDPALRCGVTCLGCEIKSAYDADGEHGPAGATEPDYDQHLRAIWGVTIGPVRPPACRGRPRPSVDASRPPGSGRQRGSRRR